MTRQAPVKCRTCGHVYDFDPEDDACAAWCEKERGPVPMCPACRTALARPFDTDALDVAGLRPHLPGLLLDTFALLLSASVGVDLTPEQRGLLLCACPVHRAKIKAAQAEGEAAVCRHDAALRAVDRRGRYPRRTPRHRAERCVRLVVYLAWFLRHPGDGPEDDAKVGDQLLRHAVEAFVHAGRADGTARLWPDDACEREAAVALAGDLLTMCQRPAEPETIAWTDFPDWT